MIDDIIDRLEYLVDTIPAILRQAESWSTGYCKRRVYRAKTNVAENA